MFLNKNHIMRTYKHAKLVKSLLIVCAVIGISCLFAFSWQKYDDKMHPEGNESNYTLPNAFVDFLEIVSNFIEEHSQDKDEYAYVTETDADGKERVVKIVVGKEDPDNEENAVSEEETEIIEDHGGICECVSQKDESEFDTVLFIGDYFAYNTSQFCFKNARYAYVTGYDLNYILNKKLFSADGVSVTLADYVKSYENIDTIYITFSAESISWMDTPTYVIKFEAFLDLICSDFPDKTIYVMPILPINDEMAAKREYTVTNEKINEINTYIEEMVLNKELWYLDMHDLFTDEKGQLPAEYTTNGIRFNDSSYAVWKEYILTYGKKSQT